MALVTSSSLQIIDGCCERGVASVLVHLSEGGVACVYVTPVKETSFVSVSLSYGLCTSHPVKGVWHLQSEMLPRTNFMIICDFLCESSIYTLSYFPPAINDIIKCEQERSVHLFIDSLLNGAEASKAYSCGSNIMFECGVCLRCHKNHCNMVGYNARRVHKAVT